MDKDRLDRAAKTIAGTHKVINGTAIVDQKTADGENLKTTSTLDHAVGESKDAIKPDRGTR